MTHLDTLNRGELLDELFEIAREKGIKSREEWEALVDDVLAAHLDDAELNPDQDLPDIKTDLVAGWEEYGRESSQESDRAMAEDPEAPHA
jgi:uncharacterized protein YihD (DUF1040 family)